MKLGRNSRSAMKSGKVRLVQADKPDVYKVKDHAWPFVAINKVLKPEETFGRS